MSELAALQIYPSFLKFFPKRVILHTDLKFLPKVICIFCLSQDVVLPVISHVPSWETECLLHSLGVRVLLCYVKNYRVLQGQKPVFLF